MEKKAIIFDMDGVLIDSEPVFLDTFRRFLEHHGRKVTDEMLIPLAGASSRQTWVMMAKLWGEEIDPQELRTLYHTEFPGLVVPYKEVLFPEARPALETLKNAGYILALASSSSVKQIGNMLEVNDLREYFQVIVSGEMFRESKPNPEIYLHTLKLLGLEAKDCLVIEDSTYGIHAARNAGIEVAAIRDTRYAYEQHLADFMIESVKNIEDLLKDETKYRQ